jgi:alpha-tubulin suppressor-like RCC1 family protein
MNNVAYYSTGYIMGAIKNDSTGWAWGHAIEYPTQVITGVKFLDASSVTISYIKHDGTVWSIGSNFYGNFGNGSTNSSDSIPIKMQNITNAVRVANNILSTIILLNDSSLMAVGTKDAISVGGSAIGLGDFIDSTFTPLPITGLPKIIDIKSNYYGTIALDLNGEVYYWGIGAMDTSEAVSSPIKIPNLSNIVAISGCDDGYHFMALDENKNCLCLGNF